MSKINVKPQYKELVKLFDSLTGSKSLWQVFNDCIEMFAISIQNTFTFDDGKDGIECHKLAISTLEKQIPKKPYEDYNGEIHKDKCPTCHRSLFPNEHHCKCGQALDWSD